MYVLLRPRKWHPEVEFKVGSLVIKPDVFLYAEQNCFLEVDNMQRWNVNVSKMETYSKLKRTGVFEKKYGKFPLVIWVTTFPGRKEKLEKLSKDLGVTVKVYLDSEVKA